MHIENTIQTNMVNGNMTVNELLARIEKMRNVPVQTLVGSKMTLDELYKEWVGSKSSITVSTKEKYDSLYRNHIKGVFGSMTLDKITRPAIQDFANEEKEKYAVETVKAIFKSVLSPIMEYAVDEEYIKKNPCKKVDLPKRDHSNHKNACSDREFEKLWSSAKEHRLGFTVMLLGRTGMRREELLGLTWDNVDLKSKEIHVVQAYTKTCVKGKAVMKDPKTEGSRRIIFLPDSLIEILKQYKKTQPKGYKYLVNIEGHDRPMYPDNYSKMFQRWVKKASIRSRLTPHVLRHYAIEFFSKRGFGLEDISQISGHTNLATMEKYYTDFHDRNTPIMKSMIKLLENETKKIVSKRGKVA